MSTHRVHPWLFMVLILPFGVMSGYLTVAVAYLLTKSGVPVGQIAGLIALGILPHTWKFLWAPIADTTLTRKGWYVIGCVASALGIWAIGAFPATPAGLALLSAVVVISSFAVTLVGMATESLMAYDTAENEKGRAGGWFQAGNLGGSGLGGGAGLWMAQHLAAPWMAGAILGGLCLLCCLALFFIPEPHASHREQSLARSLANVGKDLWCWGHAVYRSVVRSVRPDRVRHHPLGLARSPSGAGRGHSGYMSGAPAGLTPRLRAALRCTWPLRWPAPIAVASRGFLAIACACVAVSTACAPLPPQGGIEVGAQSDQWMVRWDPELRTPISLVNRSLAGAPGAPGTVAVTEAVAEQAVREVFRDRALWFNLRQGVDDFRVVRSYTRGWLRYTRFEQTYRGIPVAGAGYEANVLANGRVGSIEGRYHPGLTLDTAPLLGAEQAENRAQAVFSPGSTAQSVPSVQFENENGFRARQVLTIVPIGRRYVLAWGVIVPAFANEHARVYIDARDGTPIGRQMVGRIDPR